MADIIAKIIDKVANKYYGKYRGKVTDNQDPKTLGRIRAKVPELIGDQETGWALPCLPYGGSKDTGLFIIPEKGSNVWIEFQGGDLSYPIWTGTWWAESDSDGNEVPSEAQSTEPSVKILKTKTGHMVELNDTEGQQKVVISNKDGSSIKLDSTGITISTDNDLSTIKLDTEGITLSRGANSLKVTDVSVTINDIGLEVM